MLKIHSYLFVTQGSVGEKRVWAIPPWCGKQNKTKEGAVLARAGRGHEFRRLT